MIFRLTVIRTLLGSAFCGRPLTTIRAYVTMWSSGMFLISSCDMKTYVLVPLVIFYSCASRPSSLQNAFMHTLLVWESLRSSSSFVIVFRLLDGLHQHLQTWYS